MVAPIIIVEDLHPSYILNRKVFNTKPKLCLSLFTDEHNPPLIVITHLADTNRGGKRPTAQLRLAQPSLSLFTPLADADTGATPKSISAQTLSCSPHADCARTSSSLAPTHSKPPFLHTNSLLHSQTSPSSSPFLPYPSPKTLTL